MSNIAALPTTLACLPAWTLRSAVFFLAVAVSGFAQGEEPAITIDKNGRVGINTAPNEPLEVTGRGGASGRFIVSDGKGTQRKTILLEAPGAAPGPGKDPYGRILAHQYGAGKKGLNLILQDSGGMVGIGTTDPAERLHVGGGVKIDGTLSFRALDAAKVDAPAIKLWGNSHTIGIQDSTTFWRTGRNFKWYKGGAYAKSGPGKDGVELMSLSGDEKKLHVKGDLQVDGRIMLAKEWWIRGLEQSDGKVPVLEIGRGDQGYFKVLSNGYINPLMAYRTSLPGGVGGVKSGYWYLGYSSDARLKTHSILLRQPLKKVRALNGVTYAWNDMARRRFTSDLTSAMAAAREAGDEEALRRLKEELTEQQAYLTQTQVGVMAQDVEAVLPEAVTLDEDGYRSVAYHMLIPLLIEAVKEQDGIVAAQAERIARQEAEIEQLKKMQARQAADLDRVASQISVLTETVRGLSPSESGVEEAQLR